jgi:hypothetical protein
MSFCEQDGSAAAGADEEGAAARAGGITDEAFAHMRGISELCMIGCTQRGITDAAFEHIRGVAKLDMRYCTQPTITPAVTTHVRCIPDLSCDDRVRSWLCHAPPADAAAAAADARASSGPYFDYDGGERR